MISPTTLNHIYSVIQIVSAIVLIVTVLLQRQSSSLSGAFGGEGASYSTRRGPEKVFFTATVFLAIVFIAVTIARDMLI